MQFQFFVVSPFLFLMILTTLSDSGTKNYCKAYKPSSVNCICLIKAFHFLLYDTAKHKNTSSSFSNSHLLIFANRVFYQLTLSNFAFLPRDTCFGTLLITLFKFNFPLLFSSLNFGNSVSCIVCQYLNN